MKHQYDTTEEEMRPSIKEIHQWKWSLEQLHQRIAPRFARPEPRHHALLYLEAILSEIPRKNSWQIAEHALLTRPYGMQRLLSKAVWDVNGVRDDLRKYVLEQLGTQESMEAILVPDESGIPKEGKKSAGVKNQYCGLTGCVQNCQVGVFLSYVTRRGHAFIDRDLYLPEDWIDDPKRCREAGIADDVAYRPKWELALNMIKRARLAGLPFGWIVADEVYGQARELRRWLEQHGYAYALAIPYDEAVCVQTLNGSYMLAQARELEITLLQEQDWHRLPMSQGTKGPRMFDWAMLPVMHQGTIDGRHFLVMRRCIDDPSQTTYYLVFAPVGTTLQKMVWAIGARWHVEEDLQASKGLGLDQYEVRSFIGWYRHVTLVMLAYAFLVGIRVHDQSHLQAQIPLPTTQHSHPLMPLTTSEIQHLLARLCFPLPFHATLVQAWSHWRREHQYWASYYHMRARLKAG
ncbi:MAG: IS701 family transposase [Chloroflexi bacterium]|nr:MAG: IS701 family transposase [Chloroflexota bacterium]